MAQLDRLLSVMVSNRANALLLNEGEVAQLDVAGGNRPVTKQPLTPQQVVMLLREIAPADAGAKLEAGQPAIFQYSSDDGVFVARATLVGGKWEASVRLDGEGTASREGGMLAAAPEPAISRGTPARTTPVSAMPNAQRPTPSAASVVAGNGKRKRQRSREGRA